VKEIGEREREREREKTYGENMLVVKLTARK
jgi:hypothetical protein